MKRRARYPRAIDPKRVGKYPALTKSGAGYFWDEVLEYRVWCHPERGAKDDGDGNDYFYAFCTYPEALAFSKRTAGAERPLVLIRQKEHVNEPEPGRFLHVKRVRVTEWNVAWLKGSKRNARTIPQFLRRAAQRRKLAR